MQQPVQYHEIANYQPRPPISVVAVPPPLQLVLFLDALHLPLLVQTPSQRVQAADCYVKNVTLSARVAAAEVNPSHATMKRPAKVAMRTNVRCTGSHPKAERT